MHKLKHNDLNLRNVFVAITLEGFQSLNNIIFSGEGHFPLNSHISKQNCRYSEIKIAKSHVFVQSYSLCGYFTTRLLFLSEWASPDCNSKFWPLHMLGDFFFLQLHEFAAFNMRTSCIQQDGATCHMSNQPLSVINEMYKGNWYRAERILRRFLGLYIWPPVIFFRCWDLKSRV